MMAFTKTGILPLVLLTFGILVTFVPSSYSIKCHACAEPDCANPSTEDCAGKVSCVKVEGSSAKGEPIKSKGCAPDIFPKECREGKRDEKGEIRSSCYCNEDLCNGDGGKPREPPPPPPIAGAPTTHRQSTSTWLTAVAICLVLKQWSHILST